MSAGGQDQVSAGDPSLRHTLEFGSVGIGNRRCAFLAVAPVQGSDLASYVCLVFVEIEGKARPTVAAVH